MQRPSFGIDKKKKESGFSRLVRAGVSLDPDAQAFLTAAGITDPTISGAINTLVVQMKADNIWTKMKAIYPMVGGTASTHKWNLKDPRDLDAAFRLQFFGGWGHSANGALPNGTNAYANTFFNPSVNALLNSHGVSFYSRTNSNDSEVEIGGRTASYRTFLEIRTAGQTYFSSNTADGVGDSVSDGNSLGFYIVNRKDSVTTDLWKNGSKIKIGAAFGAGLGNFNYLLSAYNNVGSPLYYSKKECAFAAIHDGLTDTEAANFYAAVQAFQTTLGRKV